MSQDVVGAGVAASGKRVLALLTQGQPGAQAIALGLPTLAGGVGQGLLQGGAGIAVARFHRRAQRAARQLRALSPGAVQLGQCALNVDRLGVGRRLSAQRLQTGQQGFTAGQQRGLFGVAGAPGGLALHKNAVDGGLELAPQRVLDAARQRHGAGLLLPVGLQRAHLLVGVAVLRVAGQLGGQVLRLGNQLLALGLGPAPGLQQRRLDAAHAALPALGQGVARTAGHGVLDRPELTPGGVKPVERAQRLFQVGAGRSGRVALDAGRARRIGQGVQGVEQGLAGAQIVLTGGFLGRLALRQGLVGGGQRGVKPMPQGGLGHAAQPVQLSPAGAQ